MTRPDNTTTAHLWALLFVLLPAMAGAAPLRIAVISDMNGAYGATRYDPAVSRAVHRIIALRPDLVISTGDMVAGQRRPHLTGAEIEAMWAAFHANVSEPLARSGIALAVTPGNHDASAYRGFGGERKIYARQWLPRKPVLKFLDDANYPFHYAFSLGGSLFVSLDATAVGPLPAAQMKWLKRILEHHGARFEHRVVFGHLPLWPLAQGRESEVIGDPALESLLQSFAVDLVLSGHHHAFYPGSANGIGFLGQACLGAGPRHLIGTRERSARSFTWLRLTTEGIEAAAYAGAEFDQAIDWQTLPRRISSSVADLVRADLAGSAPGLQPVR